MEFMIADDIGLCRHEENVAYASFMVGDVWGFDGYAFGAFHGFESAKRVTEDDAIKFIMDGTDMSEDEAKKLLYAPALEKKETIDHLVDVMGWTRKEAMDAIGVSTYDD